MVYRQAIYNRGVESMRKVIKLKNGWNFTFYGGIYRDIEILIVKKEHFDLDYYGGPGIKYTTSVSGKDADVNVVTYINEAAKEAGAKVVVELLDDRGNVIADGEGQDVTLHISNVHLWDGLNYWQKVVHRYLFLLNLPLLQMKLGKI